MPRCEECALVASSAEMRRSTRRGQTVFRCKDRYRCLTRRQERTKALNEGRGQSRSGESVQHGSNPSEVAS